MSKHQFQNDNSILGISRVGNQHENIQLSSLPSNTHNDNSSYKITINAPFGKLGQNPSNVSQQHQQVQKFRRLTTKNPFNIQNTGYQINREMFSEEDIIDAFGIIDINHDGCLTIDDLSFFLKCLDEPHTMEQLQEMISIINKQNKKITIQEFKKIGKGKIIPFAGMRQPEPKSQQKQIIINNLREMNIIKMQPNQFLQMKKQSGITYQKYQQQRARKQLQTDKDNENIILDINSMLRLRTYQQIQEKKNIFSKIITINIEKIIDMLKDYKKQIIQIREFCQILGTTQNKVRQFFGESKKINIKQAMVDIVLFSNMKNLRKLQLVLSIAFKAKNLDLNQWIKLLTFLMGSNQNDFIKKRLESILKHKKIAFNAEFDKYFIYQIMTQQYSLFSW